MCVGVSLSRRSEEAAELAICVTNIRWIQMAGDVAVGHATMPLSPCEFRQFSERRQVTSRVQTNAVTKRQSLASHDLVSDLGKFLVMRKIHGQSFTLL